MTLSHLTDEALDQLNLRNVRDEREILTKTLHHLREMERRRLFSKFKCQSLFDYAIKRLGYSEDQAARRISAMRLMKDVPAIESKIESGALTLSHLIKAQAVFRREKKANRPRASSAKLELLTFIEKTSIRDAERTLEQETYAPKPDAKSNPLSLDQFSPTVRAKLERLLDVRSHALRSSRLGHTNVDPANSGLSDLEWLIGQLADLGIEKWDPVTKANRSQRRSEKKRSIESQAKETERTRSPLHDIGDDALIPATFRVESQIIGQDEKISTNRQRRASISAGIRHALFVRDKGCCNNCGSMKFIEIDHIIPVAFGGLNELENLRLLCRSCNQRQAIVKFGREKMASYLKSPMQSYVVKYRGTTLADQSPIVKLELRERYRAPSTAARRC